jgi:hypothetical protein
MAESMTSAALVEVCGWFRGCSALSTAQTSGETGVMIPAFDESLGPVLPSEAYHCNERTVERCDDGIGKAAGNLELKKNVSTILKVPEAHRPLPSSPAARTFLIFVL